MDWSLHINNLIFWAGEKNYHVEFVKNGDDSICCISKTIEINSSLKQSTQIIRLLHECGHVLVFENGSCFNLNQNKDESKDTVKHKVFTIIEEVEAWKRGKDLARRLKIPIEEKEWEYDMVRALKKYINWASDLKEKKDESNENKDNKSSKARPKRRGTKAGPSK